MKKYLLKRITEKSTWVGLTALAGIFGLDPHLIDNAGIAVAAMANIAAVILPEKE